MATSEGKSFLNRNYEILLTKTKNSNNETHTHTHTHTHIYIYILLNTTRSHRETYIHWWTPFVCQRSAFTRSIWSLWHNR